MQSCAVPQHSPKQAVPDQEQQQRSHRELAWRQQRTCSVDEDSNVLHDRTGRVISEPEPTAPEPDTTAEACQQQCPPPCATLCGESGRGARCSRGAPADRGPPCVSDGQERSQIVGKQAPPRPGVPMLTAAVAAVMCQAKAHAAEQTVGRLCSTCVPQVPAVVTCGGVCDACDRGKVQGG